MTRIATISFVLLTAMSSTAISKAAAELPKFCGKFPRVMPYHIDLSVNDDGSVLWDDKPTDLKTLGSQIKKVVTTNERKVNVIINFSGADKDGSRKKFLDKILARYGLAFARPGCYPTIIN